MLFVRRSSGADQVLLGKRRDAAGTGGGWCIPGGELNEGEGGAIGAFRCASVCLRRFAGMKPTAPAKATVCAGEVRVTCAAGVEWRTYIMNVEEELADWQPQWDEPFEDGAWFAHDDLPADLAPCVEGTLIEARRLGLIDPAA